MIKLTEKEREIVEAWGDITPEKLERVLNFSTDEQISHMYTHQTSRGYYMAVQAQARREGGK